MTREEKAIESRKRLQAQVTMSDEFIEDLFLVAMEWQAEECAKVAHLGIAAEGGYTINKSYILNAGKE